MRLTLLIFTCHCLVPTSEFRKYHARNNNDAFGKLNPDIKLMETREVTVDNKDPFTARCKMAANSNYEDITRQIVKGNFPKYYVKKRMSDRSIIRGLPMYQYIASRRPTVHEDTPLDDDLTQTLDPKPMAAIIPNPNKFPQTYGWIFCDRNTLKNMAVISSRRTCGIEETLVTLCLRDDTHIMLDGFWNMLDEWIPEDVPALVPYLHLGLADAELIGSAIAMKELIRNKCLQFAKIEIRDANTLQEIKMKEYLRGADMAGFTNLILRYNGCDGSLWMNYDLKWLLQPKQAQSLDDIHRRSSRNWYVCLTMGDMDDVNP